MSAHRQSTQYYERDAPVYSDRYIPSPVNYTQSGQYGSPVTYNNTGQQYQTPYPPVETQNFSQDTHGYMPNVNSHSNMMSSQMGQSYGVPSPTTMPNYGYQAWTDRQPSQMAAVQTRQ